MQHVDFSFIGIIKQMGFAAKLVGILLVIMSIWSIHVAIDRWIAFLKSRKRSARALAEAYERFWDGKLEEAVEATGKYPDGDLGQVMAAAVRSYLQDMEAGVGFNLDLAERAVEKARGIIIAKMKRGMTALATISSTAPFVGLFGTVLGVINAFVGMAKTGSGGLGSVAAGIAEALIETAAGLAVAIPAVWIYNYYNGKIEELNIEIDTVKADVMDNLIRQGEKRASRKS